MANYIEQRDAELAEIASLIGPNGTGAITGLVHHENEQNQTNGAYLNLQAYDNFTYCLVRNGATAAANGTNLQAAYDQARTATPGGLAKSANNRYTILIPAGVYDFGTTPLLIDTQYVDLVGLGEPLDVVLTSSVTTANSGTVVKSANDVMFQSITIQNTADNYVSGVSTEAAGYAPQGAYAAEVFRNVVFRNLSGTGGSSFIRRGQVFNGTYDTCRGIDAANTSVLFDGSVTGVFRNCRYSGSGFGFNMPFTGTCIGCEGGTNSFGYFGAYDVGNVWTVTVKNCIGAANSFGYQSNAINTSIVGCEGSASSFLFGARCQNVSIVECNGQADSFFRGADIQSLRGNSCTGAARSFGYAATITSMTLSDCNGATQSFGFDATYSSVSLDDIQYIACHGTNSCFSRLTAPTLASDRAYYIMCTGGDQSFSYGRTTVEGLYSDCVAGIESFAFSVGTHTATSAARFVRCSGGVRAFFGSTTLSGPLLIESTFIDCTGGNGSFCSTTSTETVNLSGSVTGCTAGTTSFSSSGGTAIFSGRGIRSSGLNYCFGSATSDGQMTGTVTDCTAGAFSFGEGRGGGGTGTRSGKMVRCSYAPRFNSGVVGGGSTTTTTSQLFNCEFEYGTILGTGAVLIGGTFIGNFTSAGAVNVNIDLIGHKGTIAGTITNDAVSPKIAVIP